MEISGSPLFCVGKSVSRGKLARFISCGLAASSSSAYPLTSVARQPSAWPCRRNSVMSVTLLRAQSRSALSGMPAFARRGGRAPGCSMTLAGSGDRFGHPCRAATAVFTDDVPYLTPSASVAYARGRRWSGPHQELALLPCLDPNTPIGMSPCRPSPRDGAVGW